MIKENIVIKSENENAKFFLNQILTKVPQE
jgi:hypothetical protein